MGKMKSLWAEQQEAAEPDEDILQAEENDRILRERYSEHEL